MLRCQTVVPVFQAVAKAGGLIKVYAGGYPDKSYKFSEPRRHSAHLRPDHALNKQAVDAGKPVVTPPYVSASTGQLVGSPSPCPSCAMAASRA